MDVATSASRHLYFLSSLIFPELLNSFLSFSFNFFDFKFAKFFEMVWILVGIHFDFKSDIFG